jgi:hypothetical protein
MNKTVFSAPSVKFLGLLIDDTLSWDKHINQIVSKLSSACYAVWALTYSMVFYGISGIANQLMRSYLNRRYQRVVMKDNMAFKLTSE